MFIKRKPGCFGCGVDEKLSRRHMCAKCEWAISQRNSMDGQRLENKIKGDEIKHLNSCLNVCEDTSRKAKEAAHIEQLILVEENIRLRRNLIKTHHELIKLRAVE